MPQPTIDDIVITPALAKRPARPRDLAAENAALTDFARQSATDPDGLLQKLVELSVELCDAGSAGVSLLERPPGHSGVFRWVAMAGAYRAFVGGTTPESFSPCGVCLQRGAAQLYAQPARVFTYLSDATPPIVEGLVVPLRAPSGPLGTIWIVSHDRRPFTRTDLAVMTTLADLTSATLALQRARADAEAASRAKDEFLAAVSHELRSPLTAIIGWSELLLSGRTTAAVAARALAAVHAHARRQTALVDDLMDASRAATGTLRLNETAVSLDAIVRSAVEMFAARAQTDARVEIVSEIPAPVPLRGDPDRLHQIVANLLDNALKFTPGGGRVVVALTVSESAVELSVRDTGIGMVPQFLSAAFDPFRQAETSSTRSPQGLGLGLAIAKRLVELHDGTIEAHSDGEGRGSLFAVRLPLGRLLAPAARVLPMYSTAPVAPSLAGTSVLVVEDEDDVRDALALHLELAGATVVRAATASEAMNVLSKHWIDVMLSDIVMPAGDGYSLMAALGPAPARNNPRLAVAVTALAAAPDRERALAAGFDAHVAKPVDVATLVQLLAEGI